MLSEHLKKNFHDHRFLLLLLALSALLAAFVKPSIVGERPVYNFTFIIDITRSMNVRDYRLNDEAVSRLDFVKRQLRALVPELPCQSKIGLAVFTDRQASLLFEPLEVCSARTEIDRVIEALDWRMAWAADSRIGKGLRHAVDTLTPLDATLVFVTDGQEAPPLNPRYRSDFSDVKGKFRGMIVGVGGLNNVTIPKYDKNGKQIGFYAADDVPHRSTFGIPNRLPTGTGNVHARNAPFGGAKVTGDQHLSRLYEPYLQQLSDETGWRYHRLVSLGQWDETLRNPAFAEIRRVAVDIRPYAAAIALCLVVLDFLPLGRWTNIGA